MFESLPSFKTKGKKKKKRCALRYWGHAFTIDLERAGLDMRTGIGP